MSIAISGSQDVELENVLQQVFLECDASLSTSTTHSAASMSDEVPITRIIEYVQNQLPIWSIEHLLELQKCLVVVSANDRVNLRQFKEATKRWITTVQKAQDGNNNLQKPYDNRNGATVDSMKMDVDRDITEIELRMRVRKFDEENITLREELVRLEELVANVERQRNSLEHQVDRYIEKCQQLEKENDEQKDKLNEAIQKEKACATALQRSRKEHENLLKQLEVAEIEVQVIPFLKDKMDKLNKEKTDYTRQIAKLNEQSYEREEECGKLRIRMAELEDTNSSIKENYESMICNLREKNRQLADENTELQSCSAFNSASRERFSISPIRDTDGCCMHSTPYGPEKIPLQNSLYAELKASGFVAEYSKNDPLRQELEEELDQYDVVISTLLEQLEKIVQIFATMLNFTDIAQFNPSYTENSRAYNIEALKHKVASVLNMATEEIARRRNIKDSSTQLRADPATTKSLDQFGISNFRNLLIRTHQCQKKTETDLRSTITQCVNDNEDDPFLRAIRANIGTQDHNIIIPIVEELDRIIQNTINSSNNYKDHSTSGNSRYKSIHTLPSNLQLSQTSSLNMENSRQASYRSTKTSSFAQGDSSTQENYSEKFAESKVESYSIPDQENLLHSCSTPIPRDDRSSEIAEVSSVLQMDPKILPTLEEASAKSFQISKVNSATAAASPRRKISVYYRSFDVVTLKDPHEDEQGSTLEVRSPLNPSMQNEEKIENKTIEDCAYGRDNGSKYLFDHAYRNAKNDSDSSNGCSPHGQNRDSLLDDELPIAQQISKKIHLAPVRLIFPQEMNSELNKSELLDITDVKDDVFSDADFSETDTSRPYLSPIAHIDGYKKGGDTSVHLSPTFFVDKRETIDDTISQGHPISAHLISPKQPDSVKIANSERPHSRTSVQRVGSDNQPRVERPVDSQMSSREYTSAVLDSESELAEPGDQCIDKTPITMGANEANGTADAVSLISPASMETPCKKMVQSDGDTKQKRTRRHLLVERSFSEGESGGRTMYRCKQCGGLQTVPSFPVENQLRVFPNLTDARLQEFGIANSTDVEIDSKDDLTELELQKKYAAFSLCLCTDRITLSRRMEMSLRQRDQSEKNLSYEVQKMQQDIQELAPLCTDRESVEKVDRVRHQLDMIARCAHRVSCAAETLGAVHQENRVSKAMLLADRYLQLLQSRCEKLATNLAETKRILTENNIVIEENSSELSDDISRIRYRSGTPANNRMMMARRRASVATMSRPGNTQDVIKDTMRQRNSVSGRVTLRRPSLTYETPKRELEKLDRTNSSSSIGELRDISEHIESQRDSTEKNNNTLQSNQSDSQRHSIVDNETWTSAKQETCPEIFFANENTSGDSRLCVRSSHLFRLRSALTSWHMVMWTILIFFFGFYVNHVISTMSTCNSNSLLSKWSIEEILKRYVQVRRNTSPHPI